MVIAIIVYKFELNRAASGEIEPDFRRLHGKFSQDAKDTNPTDLITSNDLYGIFFNHTSGLLFKGQGQSPESFLVARLKETPHKVISYYRQAADQAQYLVVSFFKLDEDAELFEGTIRQMAATLTREIFETLATGNAKDFDFQAKIQEKLEKLVQFYIFQIERASNLDKLQKVALIYSSPERLATLEKLRNGPVARQELADIVQKINENANVDIVLKPFLELNMVRRDWAKGYYDHQAGIIRGEGEYLFLIKDVALVKKPPFTALGETKKDSPIYTAYREKVTQFYNSYNPFGTLSEESRALAHFLLDPEIYDFLTILKNKAYSKDKIASIVADYTGFQKILQGLVDAAVVATVTGTDNQEWACLLGEITPVVVFPEYLVAKIEERVAFSSAKFKQESPETPLTPEVAQRALDLLETTYNEKIEF